MGRSHIGGDYLGKRRLETKKERFLEKGSNKTKKKEF